MKLRRQKLLLRCIVWFFQNSWRLGCPKWRPFGFDHAADMVLPSKVAVGQYPNPPVSTSVRYRSQIFLRYSSRRAEQLGGNDGTTSIPRDIGHIWPTSTSRVQYEKPWLWDLLASIIYCSTHPTMHPGLNFMLEEQKRYIEIKFAIEIEIESDLDSAFPF